LKTTREKKRDKKEEIGGKAIIVAAFIIEELVDKFTFHVVTLEKPSD
jgi:hypothetical protein